MDNEKFQELVLEQLQALNNRLSNVENGQKSLEHGQKSLQQSLARIEHEHGEKLSALFDGYKLLSEKLDDHTEILKDHTTRLTRIEEKIIGHEIKIEVLDQTKANKRRAK